MRNKPSRREFVRGAAAATSVAALARRVVAQTSSASGSGIPTRELGKTGQRVSIVCLDRVTDVPLSRAQFDAACVELVELRKGDGFSLATLRRLTEYVRSKKATIIHTHNPPAHHYGVLAARLSGAPVVVNTLHGSSTLDMPAWARALYGVSCAMGHAPSATAAAAAAILGIREMLEVTRFIVRSPGAVPCGPSWLARR